MDRVGDDDAPGHDAPAVSDLLDLGVDEQIGIAALQRSLAEGLDLLVEQGADARNLRTGDAQPKRLDELVDAAGPNATDIGLLETATSACSLRLRGRRKLGK